MWLHHLLITVTLQPGDAQCSHIWHGKTQPTGIFRDVVRSRGQQGGQRGQEPFRSFLLWAGLLSLTICFLGWRMQQRKQVLPNLPADVESYLVPEQGWHCGTQANSFQEQMESRAPCGTGMEFVQALPPLLPTPLHDWGSSCLPSSLLGSLFTHLHPWSTQQREGSQLDIAQWERLGLLPEGLKTFWLPLTIAGAIRGREALYGGWVDGSKLLRQVGACNVVLLFIKAAVYWKPAVNGQYDNCNGTY